MGAGRVISGRLDLLRGHVAVAFDARPLEPNAPEVRDIVDAYIRWPARKVDIQAALALLRETEEALVLAELRKVATEICSYCETEACRRKGDPDCAARTNANAGMPEWLVRKTRAEAWRKVISEREARRAA
jgi:hypothetical protein